MPEPTKRELAEWYKRNAEAQRLVGAFLQAWASVEFALDEVVAAVLNLGPSQGVIISANITTQYKTHVAACALDFTDLDRKDIKKFRTKINGISNMLGDRHMVAHCGFFPHDNGDGVRFFYVKAKSELEQPGRSWSRKDFDAKFAKMNSAADALLEIAKAVKHSKTIADLLKLLADATRQAPTGPSALDSLFPQTLASPSSGLLSANGQKDPQTPPSSEE